MMLLHGVAKVKSSRMLQIYEWFEVGRFKVLTRTSWYPAFVDNTRPRRLQCIAPEHIEVWPSSFCLWHSMSTSTWTRSVRSFFLRPLPPKPPIPMTEFKVHGTVCSSPEESAIFTAKFKFLTPSSLLFRISCAIFLEEMVRHFLQTWLAQRILPNANMFWKRGPCKSHTENIQKHKLHVPFLEMKQWRSTGICASLVLWLSSWPGAPSKSGTTFLGSKRRNGRDSSRCRMFGRSRTSGLLFSAAACTSHQPSDLVSFC